MDATGLSIKAKGYDGLVKKITAHEFSSLSDGVYTFSSTPAVTYTIDSSSGAITSSSSETFSFGVYDTLNPQAAYAVMFLFELDATVAKSKGSVSLNATTTTSLDNSLAKKTLDESNNPMSSIVDFFSSSSTSNKATYTITAPTNGGQRFLDLTDLNSPSYTQTLNQGTYATFEGDTSVYIQVVCEYNIENIEKIYNLNISNSIFNSMTEEQNISYSQDWTVALS